VQATEPLVILIEDEPQIRRFLRITLGDHGFRLVECTTAAEGLNRIEANQPDLVLLDLGLPDMDGLETTKRIREKSSVPIIVVSARDQEEQKIRALDNGADDFVTKPFGSGELLARMRAAVRRASSKNSEEKSSIFTAENVSIDFEKRIVMKGDQEVHLTPNEYDLLVVLVENSGRVLTHRQLLKQVWGDQYTNETHYLRVYMAQLRQKLEDDPARPRHLTTEAGVGYRFRP